MVQRSDGGCCWHDHSRTHRQTAAAHATCTASAFHSEAHTLHPKLLQTKMHCLQAGSLLPGYCFHMQLAPLPRRGLAEEPNVSTQAPSLRLGFSCALPLLPLFWGLSCWTDKICSTSSLTWELLAHTAHRQSAAAYVTCTASAIDSAAIAPHPELIFCKAAIFN